MKEHRHKKLEGMVQELISEIIFEEVADLEENFGIITITRVKVSSDLSYLDIFVSCFQNTDTLAHELAKYNHQIQHKLNKKLPLYKLPKVRFRYDGGGERAGHITQLLQDLDTKNV